LLIGVGVGAWQIGEKLSSDAVSMAVGVLFGILAGIPTALLVLVGNRDGMPTRRQPTPQPQVQIIYVDRADGYTELTPVHPQRIGANATQYLTSGDY